MEAEALARMFHDSYELLAPHFGYETRKASAVPWEQVPQPNRDLMIAVCRNVMWPALAAAESRGRAEERAACRVEVLDALEAWNMDGEDDRELSDVLDATFRARAGPPGPTGSDQEQGAAE